jgi:hypothetical protein
VNKNAKNLNRQKAHGSFKILCSKYSIIGTLHYVVKHPFVVLEVMKHPLVVLEAQKHAV